MHTTTFLSIIFASLTPLNNAAPIPVPPNDQNKIGVAYHDDNLTGGRDLSIGNLYYTACINFQAPVNKAYVNKPYRCRFLQYADCQGEHVGPGEGVQGPDNTREGFEPEPFYIDAEGKGEANSATCWTG